MAYQPNSTNVLYLTGSAVDVANYNRAIVAPISGTESNVSGSMNSSSGSTLLGMWITDALGLTAIDNANWTFNFYMAVSDASGNTGIRIYVSRYNTLTSTETSLYNFTVADINDLTPTLQSIIYNPGTLSLNNSDRLTIKVYGFTDSVTARTLTLYYLGTTNQSRIILPTNIAVIGDMTKLIYNNTGNGVITGTGGSGSTVVSSGSSGMSLEWFIDGTLSTGSQLGATYIFPSTGTLGPISAHIKTPGTSGSTVVDILLSGSSIFSGTKIVLTAISSSGIFIPTTAITSASQTLTMNIDSVGTGAGILSVIMSNVTTGTVAVGGGGGHTIVNSSGSTMPQESNLKFIGATLSDNGGSTIVTITSASGAGTGSVNTSGSVTSGNLAVFADNSGSVIKDGGIIHYPTRATMWHDEAFVVSGSAFISDKTGHEPLQNYGHYLYQPPANGDTFTNNCELSSGSYVFSVLGVTANSCGEVDWYIDDVLSVSGQDWYSSGASVKNVRKTASVTVTGNGRHVIKGVVNGNNGSSSSYYIFLTKYWFAPSSDTSEVT